MPEQSHTKALPACQKCQYYKVTWDKNQPHGCLFFSFKSYHLPAVEVQRSTGMACPRFRLSSKHSRHSPEENFTAQVHTSHDALAPDHPKPKYSKDGKFMDISEHAPEKDEELPSDDGPENNEEANASNASNASLGRVLGKKGILL